MQECKYFAECEFVLHYVAQVAPHWNDFVTHYCRGEFQDVCERGKVFEGGEARPAPGLMPTGQMVPDILTEISE
jgi:hypothetical protein